MSRQRIYSIDETPAEVDASLEALNYRIEQCLGKEGGKIKNLQTQIENIARDERERNPQRYAARTVAELLGCANIKEENWLKERATQRVTNVLIEFVQENSAFFEESRVAHIRNQAAIFRYRGFGLELDLTRAHDHCLFGINERNQDSAVVMMEVGKRYEEIREKEDAERCFQSATLLGNAEARYHLAKCRESLGRRESRIIPNYEQAASNGVAAASLALARHHYVGTLVAEKDHAKALKFYVDAIAQNGGKEAKEELANFNPDFDAINPGSLNAQDISRAIIEMAKVRLFDKLESGFIGQFVLKKKDELSLADFGLIASSYYALNLPEKSGCFCPFAAKKEKSSLEIIEESIGEKITNLLVDAGLNKERLVDGKINFDFSDKETVQCRFKFKMKKNPMVEMNSLPSLDNCHELADYRYDLGNNILIGDLVKKSPSPEITPDTSVALRVKPGVSNQI